MKRIILRGGALLELDQVRHVLAVVKYRTFLEASFQLNRSQSSLSKSIRRLEEELGISIFERTTRRVELTPAGRDFVAYAEQMMVCYEGMLHAMEQHRSNGKRSLRVGSIYFGLHNRLAPLVANFSKLHPSMEIEIRESTTRRSFRISIKGSWMWSLSPACTRKELSGPISLSIQNTAPIPASGSPIRSWSAGTTPLQAGASSHMRTWLTSPLS